MSHGGKRKGSGRKVSKLPPEILDQLGSIPIGDPLGQARWWTNAIGILTLGVLEGKAWKELLETVRASAGAAGRVLPHDIVFEAARILQQDDKNMKGTGGAEPSKRKESRVAGGTVASRRDPT